MRLTKLAVGDRAEIVLRCGAKRIGVTIVEIEEHADDYAMVRVAWRHPAVVRTVRFWISEYFLYRPVEGESERAERVRKRRSRWPAPNGVARP